MFVKAMPESLSPSKAAKKDMASPNAPKPTFVKHVNQTDNKKTTNVIRRDANSQSPSPNTRRKADEAEIEQ